MDWYLRYWPYLAAYHLFGLFWCAPSLGAVPPPGRPASWPFAMMPEAL